MDARGPGGEFLRKLDRGALVVIEDAAARAAGLLQGLDLLVRHALPLRRSGVSAASILTTVHDRRAEVRQLLDFRGQRARRPDLIVELDKGTQDVGLMRHDLEEVN